MKTITGTFTDAQGNAVANGVLRLQLNQDAVVTGTAQIAPNEVVITLNASGQIPGSTQVYGNDELTPSGTVYIAGVYTALYGGSKVYGAEGYSITGTSPINLNLLVPTSANVFYPSAGGFGFSTVAFSATPTFNAGANNVFQVTLTGNVTSSTLSGAVAGQILTFILIQDATGSRTFVWPTNVKNASLPLATANSRMVQSFIFDGSNAYPIGPATIN